MAINFPSSPSVNETHTSGGKEWKWNGSSWVLSTNASNYTLPIATGIALGGIKVGSRLSIDSSTGVLDADVQGGTTTFTGLTDTPGTLTAGKHLKVNAGATALEYVDNTFTNLTDTPASLTAGKWLKVNVGGTALEQTNAPAASAVGQYANTTSFPATNTNTATFAFAQDSGALYYSDGTSWTNNRVVTTNSTSHSDVASLIGLMQKTYTFDVDDYTESNTTNNNLRKIVKLTDNLGNVQRWTLGVAGDGISISKTINPTGDDEILLTGEVQQYTPSIVDAAPAADSILRLTGAGFDTGEQDITFKGVDGLKVERVDDSTIQFRSPTSTAYYDNDAKDAAFAALDGGTKVGIQYTYDPTNHVINSTVTSSGSGNNPVITYDLLGTNNTTNVAIIQLVPSNGINDEIQFVGANGTTVAWDAANAKVTIESTSPVTAAWTSTTGLS